MRGTNRTFGLIILAGIIATYLLSKNPNDPGGLAAGGVALLTFGALIAWIIQLMIDHKAAKQAPKVMTPDEQARYKRNRILVVIGLILFILSPFIFGH